MEALMNTQLIYEEFLKLSALDQKALYEELYVVVNQTSNALESYLKDIREARFSNKPHCPYCKSRNIKGHGKYKGRQRYKCKDCNKTFNDITASPMAGTHYPEKWAKHIQLMTEGKTLQEVSDALNIHISTAFKWRHKVLNALKSLAADHLTGIVESDEKFFLESKKGKNQVVNAGTRNSRERGGTSTKRGLSKDQVCIVVAMDREGHIVNKTAGRGKISATAIDDVIGKQIDNNSILCTDSSTNYKSFALNNHLEHKTLNGSKKQHVVGKIYHIQHVNSYHSRLENWINHKFKGVATKYMDNYLSWIRFMEITRNMDKNTKKKILLITMFKSDIATTVELCGAI
jgi:transposase-like protein